MEFSVDNLYLGFNVNSEGMLQACRQFPTFARIPLGSVNN